jgi:hypothetical protein
MTGCYYFCVPPCRPQLRKSLLSRSSRKLCDPPLNRGRHSTAAMYHTGFDSLDFAPPVPVLCEGPHAELRPRRAEREGCRAPSAPHQVHESRPRSSVCERTPKQPRGRRRYRSHAPREAHRARLLACCSGKQDRGKEMHLHLPIGDERADRRG